MEQGQGRIVWRTGSEGYERRAVLLDENDKVLYEGQVIPYTFGKRDDESDAHGASARDVVEWAEAHNIVIVDKLLAE